MGSTSDTQVIALTDADRTYYLLPERPFGDYWGRLTWTTADDTPIAPCKKGRRESWCQASGSPQDLTVTRKGQATRTGYKLRDMDALSPKFPAELSNEEFAIRGVDDLYEAVYVYGPDENLTFPASGFLVIDDATPAPDDGLTWVANIRDELRHHPEVHHLFPGHLTGFRAAMAAAVEALPFMPPRRYLGGPPVQVNGDLVIASREVPYEPKHVRFVRDIGRSGRPLKSGREVAEVKKVEVRINVPDRIPGATRAEARREWDSRMAAILAEVAVALTTAPCWHCQGTGIVASNARQG